MSKVLVLDILNMMRVGTEINSERKKKKKTIITPITPTPCSLLTSLLNFHTNEERKKKFVSVNAFPKSAQRKP